MTPILDLDDWALSLWADNTLLYSEPAIALENDGKLIFGRTAAAEARIHPRRINHGFLTRLSADPLPQPFKSARNHADLFYHQLRALAVAHPLLTREPVLMVVRSSTSADQLGLALGVAKECGIRIGGFVDRSIAALASRGGMGERRCLEFASDHAEVITARLGVDVVRNSVNTLPGLGLQTIQDGWANVIADAFIQGSRFDPLHAATTEQQLYDAVRSWLDTGKVPAALSIEHLQEVRRIDIHSEALDRKLLDRLDSALSAFEADSTLCLGPNATSVPGLSASLRSRGVIPIEVGRTTLFSYIEKHVGARCNPEEVRLFTTLPAATPPALADFRPSPPIPLKPPTAQAAPTTLVAPAVEPSTAGPNRVVASPGQPTHGLHGTIAFPLGGTDLPWSLLGDNPRTGITLEIGGRLFTLIEVR
ncbi:MAG: hypothetical protein FJ194_06225 [Gammaproteobacteria bacterium]|nr:hypothetical protein [Gammaproteobacteria bacterium]